VAPELDLFCVLSPGVQLLYPLLTAMRTSLPSRAPAGPRRQVNVRKMLRLETFESAGCQRSTRPGRGAMDPLVPGGDAEDNL
jgi:hypothetical protein